VAVSDSLRSSWEQHSCSESTGTLKAGGESRWLEMSPNAGTQYCYGSPTYDSYAGGPTQMPGTIGPVVSPERSDVDLGLQHIRQMDPTFDEAVFRETSSDIFFKIQAGWANRDLEPVKDC